ncbi:uncharacterized protein LOC111697207 [Eurytemora carolleeae]|uniref:uncharacterized protein LOC111697207 n=1 Tax=Eurytemora carolleeae TaxID=1294199 RepID=UPI000C78E891|nr:uncharacterized protein LOC111697207 [Eurytemora carolleeae]|eukprot:XP_023322882.1 uncharacterized protein LOC111697207 [Eurytemora affinis]
MKTGLVLSFLQCILYLEKVQAQFEVLSHICKYGTYSNGHRERMECWAAISFCKRDLDRGPINPGRIPRDFREFPVLEYRQELRTCSYNNGFQYNCVEKGQ